LCARLDAVGSPDNAYSEFRTVGRSSLVWFSGLPRGQWHGRGRRHRGCRRSAGVRDRVPGQGSVLWRSDVRGRLRGHRVLLVICERETAVLREYSRRRRDDATMALQRQAGWYRKRPHAGTTDLQKGASAMQNSLGAFTAARRRVTEPSWPPSGSAHFLGASSCRASWLR